MHPIPIKALSQEILASCVEHSLAPVHMAKPTQIRLALKVQTPREAGRD